MDKMNADNIIAEDKATKNKENQNDNNVGIIVPF